MPDDTCVISCIICGARFKIDINLIAKEVWCPRCAVRFEAPAPVGDDPATAAVELL